MFDVQLNATALLTAGVVALFYDFCISWLLHLRYDRQFGWSFVASGLVTFSLPSLLLIGLPHYLVLIAPLTLPLKLAFLFAFQIVLLRLLMRLQKRILSKVFKDPRKAPAPISSQTEAGQPGPTPLFRPSKSEKQT